MSCPRIPRSSGQTKTLSAHPWSSWLKSYLCSLTLFPYSTKLVDFLSPHNPVLLLKKTTSSVSMKINKAWSLQSAIDWVSGWQVTCFWGKEETQNSSPCSQKSCKNNLEMFVSALFGWNQMLAEAEAKSAAHAFLIHTDTHSEPCRENRDVGSSPSTGNQVLY